MNESWHRGTTSLNELRSHVTRMNESCHTYEWVMSHVWRSHVTRMNESCHTYEWVTSYIWKHTNESWHRGWTSFNMWRSHGTKSFPNGCGDLWGIWVMAYVRMRHVTHINKSCPTRKCGPSRKTMSSVTHMNELCHTQEWALSHTWMSCVTHMTECCGDLWGICVTAHIQRRHVTRIHTSFETKQKMTSHVWIRLFHYGLVTRMNTSFPLGVSF